MSLRTVYRYFPTRVDLLQNAAAWFGEFTEGARWDDPRRCATWRACIPQMGRIFDEHTNVFRALADDRAPTAAPRRRSRRRSPRSSGDLPEAEVRRAEAILACIRSGHSWLVLHDQYGLTGDEIVATLDWAATTLLEDVRRRNDAAG